MSEPDQWRAVWWLPLVFALAILAILHSAPPSPRWLVLRGRRNEALVAMRYLW